MSSGHVLIIGCANSPAAPFGLDADERAVISQRVSATTIVTATAAAHSQSFVATPPSVLHDQLLAALSPDPHSSTAQNVVKTGKPILLSPALAILTPAGTVLDAASIQTLAHLLSQHPYPCVLDTETYFPGPSSSSSVAALLPCATVLCAAVDDALALVRDAGAPAPHHPRGVQDLQLLGIALRHLGPAYVLLKQEFVDDEDEDGGVTTLPYVLCGPPEGGTPAYDRLRCKNPGLVRGARYSIASAIAARLAKGDDVPEAVAAAFEHVKSMVESGAFPKNEDPEKDGLGIYLDAREQ